MLLTANQTDRLRACDWEVRPAPLKEARQLIAENHYAKGTSNTACYVHGLFRKDSNDLFGVAWWLPPTRVACESVNKAEWRRVLSLSRLVIVPGVPKNACSFLLSRSVKAIRKEGRFISLVTYACESQGHTGTIYRASNWTYVGLTKPTPRWLCPETGRQVAKKSTVSRTNAEMEDLGYIKQGSFRKHKFVMHLM